MPHVKTVYKFKDGQMTVKEAECHPRKLPLTCDYIAPYWFQAIQNVYRYEKARELREVHKLISDDRIRRGYEMLRNKHIKTSTVTTAFGGDVHATVLSSNKKDDYTVIVKNYLPKKLPQYLHEREEYWANLFVDCTCPDFSMGKFRDNASVMCIHICCVLHFLIERFNMPKLFVLPEEKIVGYQKSNVEEIEITIKALPLVKFRQHINVLLLRKYRGMSSALGLSIHKVDNATNKEYDKPQWLTYTSEKDVERLIRGLLRVYRVMLQEQGVDADIKINEIVGGKTLWQRLKEKLKS